MAALNMKQLRITNTNIKIAPDLQTGSQRLSVRITTKLNPPKDPNVKNVLLCFGIFANSQDNDSISIEIESQCIFEYDEAPKSFSGEFSEKCTDIVFKAISKILDQTLTLMGYSNLNVYDKTR